MAERAARYQRALRDEWGLPVMADRFIASHGDRVLHGPFKGLRYWRGGDAPVARLLGAYESKIAQWFEQALASEGLPVFVDLGAADGYYAVGVKVVSPRTHVIAFELSATARRELADLAALNGVSIDIRRRATVRSVRTLPLADALIKCDIEGAEAEVLSPGLVPFLSRTTLIVELHENERPGVCNLLERRFSASHTVEIVREQPCDADAFSELAVLAPGQRRTALSEHRAGAMAWARFLPR